MLRCNSTNKIYIGSTISDLIVRLSSHRHDFKIWKEGIGNYISSCDVMENNDYDIHLIEDYPCENKKQLTQRERWYIENTECVNHNVPCRAKGEYYQVNKEKFKENVKIYRKKHEEKFKAYSKQYRQDNKEKIEARQTTKTMCECGAEVSIRNMSRHKKSKKHNNIPKKQKEKKDKTQTTTCECGAEVSHRHMSRHKKTKKHFNIIKNGRDLSS